MSARSIITDMAALVQRQPEAFDYVHRLELERALFALAKDFAFAELGIVISGFSDDVLQELLARAGDRPQAMRSVEVLLGLLENIQLISSGDPYIALDGEDVTLEGRREIISSLGGDLLIFLKELNSVV